MSQYLTRWYKINRFALKEPTNQYMLNKYIFHNINTKFVKSSNCNILVIVTCGVTHVHVRLLGYYLATFEYKTHVTDLQWSEKFSLSLLSDL